MKWTTALKRRRMAPPITSRHWHDHSPNRRFVSRAVGVDSRGGHSCCAESGQDHWQPGDAYAPAETSVCGEPKRINDIRTKCVHISDAFRFRDALQSCGAATILRVPPGLPLGESFLATTPGGALLFAELGARIVVSASSRPLRICAFGDMRGSHMAIRRTRLAICRDHGPNDLTCRTDKSPTPEGS